MLRWDDELLSAVYIQPRARLPLARAAGAFAAAIAILTLAFLVSGHVVARDGIDDAVSAGFRAAANLQAACREALVGVRESRAHAGMLANGSLAHAATHIRHTLDALQLEQHAVQASFATYAQALESPAEFGSVVEEWTCRVAQGAQGASTVGAFVRESAAADVFADGALFLGASCWRLLTPSGSIKVYRSGAVRRAVAPTGSSWKLSVHLADPSSGEITGFVGEVDVLTSAEVAANATEPELRVLPLWTEIGEVVWMVLASGIEALHLRPDHFLNGKVATVATGFSTSNWEPLLRALPLRTSEQLFLADVQRSLCFAHTSEPVPNMASERVCSSTRVLLATAPDSCLPPVSSYSPTTRLVFDSVASAPTSRLVTVEVCSCDGVVRECSACASPTVTAYFAQRAEVFSGLNLSVVWFMLAGGDALAETDAMAEAALAASADMSSARSDADSVQDSSLAVTLAGTVIVACVAGAGVQLLRLFVVLPLWDVVGCVGETGDVTLRPGMVEAAAIAEVGDLVQKLHTVHDRLGELKHYLPDLLCCPAADVSDFGMPCGAARAAPGTGDGEKGLSVCICFTDIQSSTVLWEVSPTGMFESLKLHNAILRSTAAASAGYEVKTMGDAFMFAFQTAQEGGQFALQSQMELLRCDWPDTILRAGASKETGEHGLLWNGLRVRMGLHCGPARVEENPITGRYDYFGCTVNTASRIESAVHGGVCGVSDEVVAAIDVESFDGAVLVPFGERTLRGVSVPVVIHLLIPAELAGRRVPLEDSPKPLVPRRRSTPFVPTLPTVLPLRSSLSSPSESRCSRADASLVAKVAKRAVTVVAAHAALSCCDPLPVRVGQFLSAVEMAANITQGTILATYSSNCVVAWNAGAPCTDHVSQGIAFMDRLVSLEPYPTHLGAATGAMMVGQLATGRRKVAAVVGGCVDVSVALAEEAELRGVTILAIGPVGECCAASERAHRCQLWSSAADAESKVVWNVTPLDFNLSDAIDSKWGNALEPHTVDLDTEQETSRDETFARAVRTDNYTELEELGQAGAVWAQQALELLDSGVVKQRNVPNFNADIEASCMQSVRLGRSVASPELRVCDA